MAVFLCSSVGTEWTSFSCSFQFFSTLVVTMRPLDSSVPSTPVSRDVGRCQLSPVDLSPLRFTVLAKHLSALGSAVWPAFVLVPEKQIPVGTVEKEKEEPANSICFHGRGFPIRKLL